MDPHFLDWNGIPEEVAPSGIGKRVLPGTGASLVMVRVPAGFKGGRHSHSHEQFVQVLSGAGVLETGQGTQTFGPGSLFYFPPDTWHAAQFDSDTVLVETNLSA